MTGPTAPAPRSVSELWDLVIGQPELVVTLAHASADAAASDAVSPDPP